MKNAVQFDTSQTQSSLQLIVEDKEMETGYKFIVKKQKPCQ